MPRDLAGGVYSVRAPQAPEWFREQNKKNCCQGRGQAQTPLQGQCSGVVPITQLGLQYVWSKDDVGGHPPGHTWSTTADSPLLCFLVRGLRKEKGML